MTNSFVLDSKPTNSRDLPGGCRRVRTHCPLTVVRCARVDPALREVDGRLIASEVVWT